MEGLQAPLQPPRGPSDGGCARTGQQADIDKAAQRALPVMNNLRDLLDSKIGAIIILAAIAGFLSLTGIPGTVVYMVTLAAWNENDPTFPKAALVSLSRKT